jgi:hypothetical protein
MAANMAMFQQFVQFDMNTFINNMKTCWGYLNHARKVAMCYACSQHNKRYFSQGKAIINQEDCGQMLNSCLPFFRGVTSYITDAHKILHTNGANNWSSHQLDTLKKLHQSMIEASLTEKITLYTASTGVAKTNCGNGLCLKLFRLYTSPIFDKVGEMVDSVTRQVKQVAAASKTAARSLIAGNPLLSRDNQGSDDPFAGDVAIITAGANGGFSLQYSDTSSAPIGHDVHKKAMNFSLSFP